MQHNWAISAVHYVKFITIFRQNENVARAHHTHKHTYAVNDERAVRDFSFRKLKMKMSYDNDVLAFFFFFFFASYSFESTFFLFMRRMRGN